MGRTIVYSAEELRELLHSHSPLVTSHLKSLDLKTALPEGRTSFVTDLNDKQNLEVLLEKPLITCLLPIRSDKLAEDAADRAAKLDRVIVSSGTSLILANHQPGTGAKYFALTQSAARWQVIEQFGEMAAQAACFGDFPEICKTVCSELITNAFYNAPRDNNGQPLETDRRIPVNLKKPVDVSFGQDENYLWLQVRDPFGTFSREALLRSLLRSSDGQKVSVNMEAGGAGIGLYMVFRWSAQLMFTFKPNQETTVLVKLLKTKRYKVFDAQRAILELVQAPE
jgi:hypothetical protein